MDTRERDRLADIEHKLDLLIERWERVEVLLAKVTAAPLVKAFLAKRGAK